MRTQKSASCGIVLSLIMLTATGADLRTIKVGEDPLWTYEIVASSVVRTGNLVRYTLAAVSNHQFTLGQYILTSVEVDCGRRTRNELSATRRHRDGSVRSEPASSSGRVVTGSRQAAEIEIACHPRDDIHPADPPIQVSPPPIRSERESVRSALRGTGTGFVVGRDGHVVTSAHVVSGCGRIEVRSSIGVVEATILATNLTIDLALLTGSNLISPIPLAATSEELGESVSGNVPITVERCRVTAPLT